MKLFLPLVPLASSVEYSPNSPAADPNGFAASITKNPLRTVFENIFNEDEGNYMASNSTWVIHDPSNIVEIDGILTMFVTGKEQADGYKCAAESWYMFPGETGWRPGNCIWSKNSERPDWITAEGMAKADMAIWAPGVLNSRKIYYSFTNGGMSSTAQCMGVVTITGTAPNLDWEDSGEPVSCSFNPEQQTEDYPTAIDPAGFVDSDGTSYVVYGGGHMAIAQVDSSTGLPNDWWPDGHQVIANGPKTISSTAQEIDPGMQPGDDGYYWAEAPFMYKNDNFYYLFYNWYGCCSTNASYEIRVCRSTSPISGFKDDLGRSCLQGHAKLLKDRKGPGSQSVGPGHPSIFTYKNQNDQTVFVFSNHYYRQEQFTGLGFMSFVEHHELVWENGWPRVTSNRWDPMSYWNRNVATTTSTTKDTTTSSTTKTTGTMTTGSSTPASCPAMQWKGKKATKIIYRGKLEGKRSYIVRQTVLNNSAQQDIRAGPYTGFFMFARRYCGTDFFDALSDGSISLGLYDYESTYTLKFKTTRIDGSKGSSVTFQYQQNYVGESDAPWSKKNGNSLKKDQFFLSIDGIPDSWDVAKEADCLNLMVGVLPAGNDLDVDYSQCASTQKDAGW